MISCLHYVSVHTLLNNLRVTVAAGALVIPASNKKMVASGGILDILSKEKIKGRKVRQAKWPNDRSISTKLLVDINIPGKTNIRMR
jgi:hypothetical protein